MLKVVKRPPYALEGEVLYSVEKKQKGQGIREMHIFTQEYFDQFRPPDENYDRWLSSGVHVLS